MRCLATMASRLQAALWRYCGTDASVLVVQLSEVVRGCTDPQLGEHGVAALQAVAKASVAAGMLHMRCVVLRTIHASQHDYALHAARCGALLRSWIAFADPPSNRI